MPPPRKASATPAKRTAPQSKSLKAPEEGIQAVVLLDASEESTLEPLLQGTPQVRGAGSWPLAVLRLLLPTCSAHLLWLANGCG
jgi:hypothetical protein